MQRKGTEDLGSNSSCCVPADGLPNLSFLIQQGFGVGWKIDKAVESSGFLIPAWGGNANKLCFVFSLNYKMVWLCEPTTHETRTLHPQCGSYFWHRPFQ